MKYTVDMYCTFGICVEVEADSIEEAEDKVWLEDLDVIIKRKLAENNGMPDIEIELIEAYEME